MARTHRHTLGGERARLLRHRVERGAPSPFEGHRDRIVAISGTFAQTTRAREAL